MDSILIYKDRDDPFTITLKKNSVVLTQSEMVAITKFEIHCQGAYYNSDDHEDSFSRDNENGTVEINPYAWGLAAADREEIEFIIYNGGEYIHGKVWSQFGLTVSDEAAV